MSQKVRKAWNPETSLAHNGFIKLIVVDALLQTNYVGNLHFRHVQRSTANGGS